MDKGAAHGIVREHAGNFVQGCIIHLQIEMDAVEASLRAMDIASEHASRQPTSRAQSPVAGTAASGSATNGGGARWAALRAWALAGLVSSSAR